MDCDFCGIGFVVGNVGVAEKVEKKTNMRLKTKKKKRPLTRGSWNTCAPRNGVNFQL